jgi:sulfur-oxidizing protein SoxX
MTFFEAGSATLAAALTLAAMAPAAAETTSTPYTIVGDAIPDSLTGSKGDPARGRTIVATRAVGLCLMCHSGPLPEVKLQGNMAPDLAGAGSRWREGQLRLRMVDPGKLNPDTIMPACGINQASMR